MNDAKPKLFRNYPKKSMECGFENAVSTEYYENAVSDVQNDYDVTLRGSRIAGFGSSESRSGNSS